MKRKTLSELTLLDKFLFDETMDDPEAHKAALQIIFGQENLKLLESAHTEKEVRTASWLRTIRLDVYAVGDDGTVYNTEMQGTNDHEVNRVKQSEHVGVKYLQRWEEEWMFREEGRLSALLESVCNLMEKTGVTADEAMEMLGIEPAVRDALYEKMNSDADMK